MPDKDSRSALAAEHRQLKQQLHDLQLEHQRLSATRATREECETHRMRLRRTRHELEEHYQRLRQLAEASHLNRQESLADTNGFSRE